MHGPFTDVAFLLLGCAIAGAIAVRFRQPVLIAYIVVGIAVGPAGFGLIEPAGAVDLLAQMGVAVLLFAVGLKLDLHHLRNIGPVALATGLGQLTFTIVLGFGLLLLLGKGTVEAIYVAVALTFSSTIIVVKLLSDKRELDSLHGRIAVGFLIVQDLAVVLAMMTMSALRGAGTGATFWDVTGPLAVRLVVAGIALVVLMRYVLPRVVATMARSQELLLLFAIAWGVALAALGEAIGFSKEAGAFIAGFSLASTEYREAMNVRLTGIRDFLLLFFFIDLGAKLELATLGAELGAAAVLSVFVLVGNPLIVLAIMGAMGYRRRTGFLAGLTVAQISEFSIVFVAMGISLGHIGVGALGLTTLIGLVTITLSTYMILYSQRLYAWLGPWLKPFERRVPFRELAVEEAEVPTSGADVLVVGVGRFGGRLLQQLQQDGVSVLGIDFDPEAVRAQRGHGHPVRFGDAEDADFLDALALGRVQWVVLTLPQWDENRAVIEALARTDFRGRIAVAAREQLPTNDPVAQRIDHLLHPFDDAADGAAGYLRGQLAVPA